MILLSLLILVGHKIRDSWWELSEIFEENKLSLFYLMLIYINTCIYVSTFLAFFKLSTFKTF